MAAEVTQLLAASGLTRAEFASAIGTSTSRLSTYLNGKVTPSAGLLYGCGGSRPSAVNDPTIPMQAVRGSHDRQRLRRVSAAWPGSGWSAEPE